MRVAGRLIGEDMSFQIYKGYYAAGSNSLVSSCTA